MCGVCGYVDPCGWCRGDVEECVHLLEVSHLLRVEVCRVSWDSALLPLLSTPSLSICDRFLNCLLKEGSKFISDISLLWWINVLIPSQVETNLVMKLRRASSSIQRILTMKYQSIHLGRNDLLAGLPPLWGLRVWWIATNAWVLNARILEST